MRSSKEIAEEENEEPKTAYEAWLEKQGFDEQEMTPSNAQQSEVESDPDLVM